MADTCPGCGYAGVESDRCPQCGATVRPGDAAARERAVRRVHFHGQASTLFGIYLVNFFLTLITVGIYTFWARVKVRTYLVSQTEFEGDRFAYHGTGKELLLGYLKAALVFGIPFYALRLLPGLLDLGPVADAIGNLLSLGVIAVLVPVAIVGARRYRLSRTSWRGIRFSFRGPVVDFAKIFLGGGLLTVVTFGLYYPFWITRRQGFMVSHAYFGSEPFRFDGKGRDLFGSYLIMLLLALPTVGLSSFWFSAARHRYFAQHTSFATARLDSSVTGGGLARLMISNVLLVLITLGLGFPWALVRSLRYTIDRVTVHGPLDLGGIVQQPQPASATGEGLAGFFDTGFDLG